MTDNEASDIVARVYSELRMVEAQHPASRSVARLHSALMDAFAAYKSERPGVVQPFDGTNKPPGP